MFNKSLVLYRSNQNKTTTTRVKLRFFKKNCRYEYNIEKKITKKKKEMKQIKA